MIHYVDIDDAVKQKTPFAKINEGGSRRGDERKWCGEGLLYTLKFSA
jgi:hypothetical protein